MTGSSIWAPIGDKGPPGDQGPQGLPGVQGPPGPDTIGFATDLANTVDGSKGVSLVGGAGRVVANVAAMLALPKAKNTFVTTEGFYTPGDLGNADYWQDTSDTTSPSNGVTIHVAADGARWKLQHKGVVTSFQAGLKRDGTTNTIMSAVLTACTVAGVILWFGAGTWMTNTAGLPGTLQVGGNGPGVSIVKAANGLNADMWTTTNGPNQNEIKISGIRLDGNRANNTFGTVLTVKGAKPVLTNLYITNAAENGIVTDFDLADGERLGGFQGIFREITIDSAGKSGWVHNGPTDSTMDNIIVIDASLTTNATYYGIYATVATKFTNCHAWNKGSTTNVPAAQVYLASAGNVMATCHIEGGITPLKIVGNQNIIQTTECYAPRGQYSIELIGTANFLSVTLGANASTTNPAFRGVGLSGTDNYVEITDGGCINGTVEFISGESNNKVSVTGYRGSGVGYVGTPHVTDEVFINLQGPGGVQFRQEMGIPYTAFGTTITPQSGAYSNATASMRYQARGKRVDVQAVAITTAIGSGTGAVQLVLPFPCAAFGYNGIARDIGNGVAYLCFVQPGSSTLTMTTLTNSSPAYNGMSANLSISYERA